ncbi:IclR family transcriptional regulator (plasmid) [Haloferacaceae archaeon DSL9]
MDDKHGSTTIRAVETTIAIVEVLEDAERMGVTEIAEATGLTKGTVHKHLATLEAAGFVVKRNRRYSLGLRFLGIGTNVRNRMPLYRLAKPAVDDLARTTGAVVNLMVPERGFGAYAYRAGTEASVDSVLHPVGNHAYLHATAGGKAILSQMQKEEIDEIIERRGLPSLTDKTITDATELRRELRSVRDRGLAFERGEHMPSLQCVAASITADGTVLGALSISGNVDRMSGKKLEEDLAGHVVSKSNEIEVALLRG